MSRASAIFGLVWLVAAGAALTTAPATAFAQSYEDDTLEIDDDETATAGDDLEDDDLSDDDAVVADDDEDDPSGVIDVGDGDPQSRCAAQFRSFDAASGTYTTYDGDRLPCPYL